MFTAKFIGRVVPGRSRARWKVEANRLHDMAAMMVEILRGYTLPVRCDHGVVHWARVGIMPKPHRLCTDTARELLGWANARAVSNHEPAEVLASWGLGQGPPNRVTVGFSPKTPHHHGMWIRPCLRLELAPMINITDGIHALAGRTHLTFRTQLPGSGVFF